MCSYQLISDTRGSCALYIGMNLNDWHWQLCNIAEKHYKVPGLAVLQCKPNKLRYITFERNCLYKLFCLEILSRPSKDLSGSLHPGGRVLLVLGIISIIWNKLRVCDVVLTFSSSEYCSVFTCKNQGPNKGP